MPSAGDQPRWSTTIEILLSVFTAGLTEGSASLLKDFALAMAIAAGGLALARLAGQPPVLGYLLAGLLIGPFTLPNPLISNLDTIGLLAELGLVLLLFGIGLELGWRRIRSIGFQVLVIGVVEISVLTLFGVWVASILPGIGGSYGLYLGGAIAISSSAILLKGLRDGGNLRSRWGETIVGILLVEDFAAVILLTVLAGLATTGSASLADAGWLVAKLGIFCIAVLVFGTLLGPRLMRMLSRSQADETLLVASLGLCFLLALGATLLGLSAAAGAFLIGVVIGDTEAAGRVIRLVSPVRDMFGALFFLSIGMLIDYRTLDDFIVPALVVVGVFMAGKIAANTIGSLLADRSPRDALRVGMTMPQMGEFSLAIGQVSPTDALGGSVLGPILSIATAITSVLAPLTARFSLPLSHWIDRSAPTALHRIILAIQLGLNTFWSALSLKGETGAHLRNAGRRILINICIVAVLAAAGTGALYAVPAIIGNVIPVSQGIAGLIMVGIVIGLSTPPVISIWLSLRTLARLATTYSDAPDDGSGSDPIWNTLRSMVQNGLATGLLALLLLLSLPLIVRLFTLSSVSAPLSVFLLITPALGMGIISFRIYRVLEPAFSDTFITTSVGREHHSTSSPEGTGPIDVGSPGPQVNPQQEGDQPASAARRSVDDPLVVAAIEHLDEQDELWQLLEERIARMHESGEALPHSRSQSAHRDAD